MVQTSTSERSQAVSNARFDRAAHRNWWQGSTPKRRLPSFKQVAIFLVQATLALAFFIMALETYFSIIGVGEQEILMPDPDLGSKHIPGKFITWRLEGYSRGNFNSQGLRDVEHPIAKPANTIRIALVGDSLTECLQVPLEGTWGRQLERVLNASSLSSKKFEVINFGCSGYSTAQEWLYYKRDVAKYQPDYVLVLYSRGDTLENTVEPNERLRAEPRPYYYFNKDGQLTLDRSVLDLNAAKLHPTAWQAFLQAHSRISGVFSQANLALLLNEKLYWKFKRTVEKAQEKMPLFAPKQSAVTMPEYPSQDKIEVSCAIVDRLASDVRANGSRFVLITFPDIDTMYGNYSDQIARLQKLAHNDGFDTIDLTPDFKANTGKRQLVLTYHLSQAGNDVTAQAVSRYFQTLFAKANNSSAESSSQH